MTYAVLFGFDTPEKDLNESYKRMLEAGFETTIHIPKYILSRFKDVPPDRYTLMVDTKTRHVWKYYRENKV
jgi:hypothetical protein